MELQLVHAIMKDHTRTLLFVRDKHFDVFAWANSRVKSFKLLGIERIDVETMDVTS